MKAAIYLEKENIEIKELPMPECGDNDVIIQNLYSAFAEPMLPCSITAKAQGLTYVDASANGLPLQCKQDLCLRDVLLPRENGCEFTSEEEFLTGVNKMADDPAWRASARTDMTGNKK